MSAKSRYLIRLLAWLFVFGAAAVTANAIGAEIAVIVFLVLAVAVEANFWWTLFTPWNRSRDPE